MTFSFWHLVGSENTINKNFSIYESPIFADLIANLAYFIWLTSFGLYALLVPKWAHLPLLYAESISAWSNQGSVMCLLSILNH